MLKDIWEAKDIAEAGDLAEGLERISAILNDDPDRPEALFIAAYCLLKTDRWAIACALLRRAAALAPHVPQVWNNLGLCLAQLRKLDEAKDCLERSLEIDPEQTAALNNLALVAVNSYEPERCIELSDRSMALDPSQKDITETRGYACLMLRRWKEGWEGYETAINNSKWRMTRALDEEPYWDGSKGKRVMIRGEQGVGDEVLFASCVPDAMRDCEHVIIECDKRLAGLFGRSFPQATVFGTRFDKHRPWRAQGDVKVDAHILSGSLPHLYRNSDDSFPRKPYLIADPERRLQWRALLASKPGLKVGVGWTAGMFNTFKHRRSFSLKTLAPLFDVPDTTFISLEYKTPVGEIKESGLPVLHWPRAVEKVDIDETAALICELDLIICPTTSAAILAGALGKPAWILCPTKAHWMYACPAGNDSEKMVWFESLRVFRQEVEGDWSHPVLKAKAELEDLHRSRQPAAGSGKRMHPKHLPQSIEAGSDHSAYPLAASN